MCDVYQPMSLPANNHSSDKSSCSCLNNAENQLVNILTKNNLHAEPIHTKEARRRRRRLAHLVMSSAMAAAILDWRQRRGSAAYSCGL